VRARNPIQKTAYTFLNRNAPKIPRSVTQGIEDSLTGDQLKRLVLDVIVGNNLPMRVVNSTSFRNLLAKLKAPTLPNRQQITSELEDLYNEKRAYLESSLLAHIKAGSKVNLGIDVWTTKTQHAFLGISIHYINPKWCQESLVLELADLKRRHTGIYLSMVLKQVLKGFGIDRSILAITRDNASNNATLFNDFQASYKSYKGSNKVYSIPCIDHVLNLVCQDILKSLKANLSEKEVLDITSNTELVKSFNDKALATETSTSTATPQRSQAKRQRLTTSSLTKPSRTSKRAPRELNGFQKLRYIVTRIRQRQHLIYALDKEIALKRKAPRLEANNDTSSIAKPTLDIPTRWNSTYHMISNYLTLKEQINEVIDRNPSDFTNLIISEDELDLIEDLYKVLMVIERYSRLLQGSSYPILNYIIPFLYDLNIELNTFNEDVSFTKEVKEAINSGLEKLYKYFPNPIDISDPIAIEAYIFAVLLDPRYKDRNLKKWGFSNDNIDVIKRHFKWKWQEYNKVYNEINPSRTSSSLKDLTNLESQTELEEIIDRTYGSISSEEDEDEIDSYILAKREPKLTKPLEFWASSSYKGLKLMAKDYLAIIASSAPIEALFSRTSDIANPRKRNRLTKQRINQYICCKSWAIIEPPIEEDINELESNDSDFPYNSLEEEEEEEKELETTSISSSDPLLEDF
jgi:hypothetical protein